MTPPLSLLQALVYLAGLALIGTVLVAGLRLVRARFAEHQSWASTRDDIRQLPTTFTGPKEEQ